LVELNLTWLAVPQALISERSWLIEIEVAMWEKVRRGKVGATLNFEE
jgi:hypothetical protein